MMDNLQKNDDEKSTLIPISSEELGDVTTDLNCMSNRLNALGELLKNNHPHACYSESAIYGLGELLTDMADIAQVAWEKLTGEDKRKVNDSD